MCRQILILLATVLAAEIPPDLQEAFATEPVGITRRSQLRSEFLRCDSDKDRKLNEIEYIAFAKSHFPSTPRVELAARRDAQLFDWNHDGKLDLNEFFSIATLLPAHEREPIVDPIQSLINRHYRVLEAGIEEFSTAGQGDIAVDTYHRDIAKILKVPQVAIVGAQLADTDKNGRVTRQEARAHLARLLGVRDTSGNIIRFDDGRVVKYEFWRQLDVNLSNSIHAREFEIFNGSNSNSHFMDECDLNHDGEVSYIEYSKSPTGMTDTPLLFCSCDLDFDGELSHAELLETIKYEPQALVQYLFPAFDDDGNGKLSFAEFSLAPISNELLIWSRLPEDHNQDQRLSFDEFTFGKTSMTFPLLRWELFRRLDTNGDGLLNKKEFDFRSRKHPHITIMNAEGTRRSSWKSALNEGVGWIQQLIPGPLNDQLAVVVFGRASSDLIITNGANFRELTDAKGASWSPDGTRFVTSKDHGRQSQIQIVNTDGSGQRNLCFGSGPKWNDDATRIAFCLQGTINVMNLTTEEITTIYRSGPTEHSQIYNIAWSPKGDQIAAIISSGRTHESSLCLIAVEGAAFEFISRWSSPRLTGILSWHPDGGRLVFAEHSRERRRIQLFEVNPETDEAPRFVPGQDRNFDIMDAAWSLDGKKLWMLEGERN